MNDGWPIRHCNATQFVGLRQHIVCGVSTAREATLAILRTAGWHRVIDHRAVLVWRCPCSRPHLLHSRPAKLDDGANLTRAGAFTNP